MNPFKNISVFRDQDIYTNCSLKPWSSTTDSYTETTPFPEKQEYKGNSDYYNSQITELEHLMKKEEHLQQENNRLQHLTTVLIEHIGKKHQFPLKEIDERMAAYDKEHDEGV
jgi:predicted phosphohydrolase